MIELRTTLLILDACKNIVALEPGIPCQDGRNVIASREHAEHVLHGETPTANDRLPVEDGRIPDDSVEEVSVRH